MCAYRHARLQKNPSTQTAPVLSVRAQWSPSRKVSALHSFTCSSACTLFSSSQQVRGLPRHDSLHDPMGVLAPLSCAIAFSSLSTTCIPQLLPSTPQWYSPSCAQTDSTEQSRVVTTLALPLRMAQSNLLLTQTRHRHCDRGGTRRISRSTAIATTFMGNGADSLIQMTRTALWCLQPRRVCGLWLSWTRSRQVHW